MEQKEYSIVTSIGQRVCYGEGSVFWYEKSLLEILSGRQTAEMYCNTLEQYCVPFLANRLKQNGYVEFQDENSPIHSALVTKNFLRYSSTQGIVFTARSWELNLIKNL